MRSIARSVTIVLSGALIAAACGADEAPEWDPSIIPAAVQVEVDPIGIENVVCDEGAAQDPTLPETGGRFECGGVLSGDDVILEITMAPAFDGEIGVAAEIVTPVFDVAAAEVQAALRLEADLGGSPEVACTERLVVLDPNRRIDCRVTADGGTAGPVDRSLTIVILDDDGNFEIDLFN